MKLFSFYFAIIIISLSSCKKSNHTCTCNTAYEFLGNTVTDQEIHNIYGTKSQTITQCEEHNISNIVICELD